MIRFQMTSGLRATTFLALLAVTSPSALASFNKKPDETVDAFQARCTEAQGKYTEGLIGGEPSYSCDSTPKDAECAEAHKGEKTSDLWPWFYDEDKGVCTQAVGF